LQQTAPRVNHAAQYSFSQRPFEEASQMVQNLNLVTPEFHFSN